MDKKPTITEVLSLVKEYYLIPGNSVGGSLHIVLDEGMVNGEWTKLTGYPFPLDFDKSDVIKWRYRIKYNRQ